MTHKEYQKMELRRFNGQSSAYFDSVQEFNDRLADMDIPEQIEWIENGSYGAGACFALQIALRGITPRCNANARIGNVILHAFYGKPFTAWKKLSAEVQGKLNKAVSEWLNKDHSFAEEIL